MHDSRPGFEVAALPGRRTFAASTAMLDDLLVNTRRGDAPRNAGGGKRKKRDRGKGK